MSTAWKFVSIVESPLIQAVRAVYESFLPSFSIVIFFYGNSQKGGA
jgi:hypothetical protein